MLGLCGLIGCNDSNLNMLKTGAKVFGSLEASQSWKCCINYVKNSQLNLQL